MIVVRCLFALLLCTFSLAPPAYSRELTPREIYKLHGRSVVLVFGTDGSAQGSAGTGSIISENGDILTNAHVVSKDGKPFKKIFVYLKPDHISGSMRDDLKQRYSARLLDIDPNLDLALLRMETPPRDLYPLSLANPDDVEIGDPVVAIGHPETGGLWTLTTGAVSSIVRDFQGVEGKDVFQTETSVNRGNSGGPLIDAYGHMVGVNTCISRKAADGLAITDINFSLKSSVAMNWLKRRELLLLAYAKPELGKDELALAGATKEIKPDETVPAPSKGTLVKDEQGKIVAFALEPKAGEEVADDPAFSARPVSDTAVSSKRKIDFKGNEKNAVPAARQLTKARPFQMDGLIQDRIEEVRALERDMEEMRKKIPKGKGKSQEQKLKDSADGMGLW